MSKLACVWVVPGLLAIVACSPPAATMVAKLPEPVEVGPRAERHALNGANTTVEAEVSAGATFTISFAKLEGTFEIDPADPSKSRLTVNVDMTTGSSTPEVVAEIAMGPEFLHAGAHPSAKLVTHRVTSRGGNAYEALGELTLRGVTHGLQMPMEIEVADCAVRALVAFSFDRHAFEIQAESSLESLVSDTVAVRFVVNVKRRCE